MGKLYGGAGVDVLRGEADNDTLDGNGGNDYLLGGKGRDTYKYDGKTGGLDYILDEREGGACLGSVEYDKQTLTGGKRKGKSQYVWKSSNGYTFETSQSPRQWAGKEYVQFFGLQQYSYGTTRRGSRHPGAAGA